jgi:hypothetical protein
MSRLKRIVRKVDGNRLQKRRTTALPPPERLRAEAKILRETGDPKAVVVANAFLAVDQMLADGWIERRGGGEATESRHWPLHEAWKGREPPENP